VNFVCELCDEWWPCLSITDNSVSYRHAAWHLVCLTCLRCLNRNPSSLYGVFRVWALWHNDLDLWLFRLENIRQITFLVHNPLYQIWTFYAFSFSSYNQPLLRYGTFCIWAWWNVVTVNFNSKLCTKFFIVFGICTLRYDTEFALENWQDRTCQFSLASAN